MAKSNDGHPWRTWKITLVAMEGEKEVKGKLSVILDHVCYILHPTFEEPRRVKTEEPYVLEEKGWGEFDMRILLYFADNLTDPKILTFDLNFAQSDYSIICKVEFPNASPELIKLLATDPSTNNTHTPRKGGKKPISSMTTSSSSNSNNSKSKSKSSSTDSNNSRQQAKKKPVSSSPHTKAAKKAKPESKEKSKPQKLSHSPTPLQHTRSPVFNAPSPSTHSSPSNSHITSDTPESALSPEEKTKYSPAHTNDEEVEHIYNMSDVYNLSSIHRAKIDEETRERWGIPEINMMELAKRIYRMTPEQSAEFQSIILNNRTDDMRIAAEKDGGFGIDLYSLGSSLLEKLWDYSADMASEDNQSYTSQDIHASDLELDSDMEQGEYNSDDDGGIRSSYRDDSNTEREEGEEGDYSRYGSGAYEPTGYREIGEYHYTPDHNNIVHNSGADEPGFHFSDSDTGDHHSHNYTTNGVMHHQSHNGGYHDTSDMDIQDDDDY